MWWKLKVAVSVSMLLFSNQCLSVDNAGKYIVLGVGNESCGEYVAFRREGNDNAYRGFVAGYFTYVNRNVSGVYNIVGGRHMDSLLLWMEQYCTANPLGIVIESVKALEIELTSLANQ